MGAEESQVDPDNEVEQTYDDEEEQPYEHLMTPEQIAAYEAVQASLKKLEGDYDADRQRARPLVYLYSSAIYDGPSMHPDDWTRSWSVQSGIGGPCGADFETFEDAMIMARLFAIQKVLGWTLEYGTDEGVRDMILTCWCGWSHMINGCYSDPLVPHVKSAHPDHPVVRG